MRYLACFLFALFVLPTLQADEADILRRSESYLGIHFDFHAGPDCTEVGKNTTPEMVATILDMVKPDYIQVDCKGHAGYTSYPTQVGNQVPGYVGDPLRVWRDVTAEKGVGLYMHYSGVWDNRAVELHPDWAVVDQAGKPSDRITSVFGAYVDELLVPQLKELAGVYKAEGVWVDGECWATALDYGDRAVRLFREITGIETVPQGPHDPHWFEWMQFHREAFRNYMRHYVAEVRKEHPRFQICSNWAFTDHMPETVSVPLDFLSGDYSANDSVNSARYSGRYLVHQGIPWDLMAWSFSQNPRHQKTTPQLQREAAVVLALGGGFQAYFTQNRDGSVRLEELEVMAEVAKFARERQKYCHHVVPVPQIALLNSTASFQKNSPGPFARYQENNQIRGVLQCLLESQNVVDVVGEHTLWRNMDAWPLIVVPEWGYLQPTFVDDLLGYAKNGGKLLVIGEATCKIFTDAMNVEAANPEQPRIQPCGNGKIALVGKNIGLDYAATQSENLRSLVDVMVRKLFPDPLVKVTGSPWVDVSVGKIGDDLTIHLVNTSGNHRDERILETIEPVGPLQIAVRCEKEPKTVKLVPGGQECPFDFSNGKVSFRVDSIPIYSIIVMENF